MNEPTTATDEAQSRQQEVGPGDIRALMAQAAGELTAAAFGGEVECSEGSLRLPHGVSIHWQPEERTATGAGLLVSLQLVDEGEGRARTIQAQANAAESPAVSRGDRMTSWTPSDGPQREWVLESLRQEIADYMPDPD